MNEFCFYDFPVTTELCKNHSALSSTSDLQKHISIPKVSTYSQTVSTLF